jgi:hypothetical protein
MFTALEPRRKVANTPFSPEGAQAISIPHILRPFRALKHYWIPYLGLKPQARRLRPCRGYRVKHEARPFSKSQDQSPVIRKARNAHDCRGRGGGSQLYHGLRAMQFGRREFPDNGRAAAARFSGAANSREFLRKEHRGMSIW